MDGKEAFEKMMARVDGEPARVIERRGVVRAVEELLAQLPLQAPDGARERLNRGHVAVYVLRGSRER